MESAVRKASASFRRPTEVKMKIKGDVVSVPRNTVIDRHPGMPVPVAWLWCVCVRFLCRDKEFGTSSMPALLGLA